MADDKQKDQPQAESKDDNTADQAKPKSDLMKYIIFAVAGIVVIGGIAFGVGFMLKESPKTDAEQTEQVSHNEEVSQTKDDNSENHESIEKHDSEISAEITEEEISEDDIPVDDFDKSAIEKIVDNLAFLDYEPTAGEISEEDGMSVEDSLEQMSWIEKEKADIEKRKKELDQQQKELEALEKSVDSKIIRIEQAESNRVSQLAKLYDSMDSRAVAKLLMNLDNETIVSILPRMKSKNAALVLQLIPSKRAATLSKQMITIADK